jgi:hypothetical protein
VRSPRFKSHQIRDIPWRDDLVRGDWTAIRGSLLTEAASTRVKDLEAAHFMRGNACGLERGAVLLPLVRDYVVTSTHTSRSASPNRPRG